MIKYKVHNNPGLIRDSKSKAIISEDKEQYFKYIQGRNFRNQVNGVSKEMQDLRSELNEIKAMLGQLLSKKINN